MRASEAHGAIVQTPAEMVAIKTVLCLATYKLSPKSPSAEIRSIFAQFSETLTEDVVDLASGAYEGVELGADELLFLHAAVRAAELNRIHTELYTARLMVKEGIDEVAAREIINERALWPKPRGDRYAQMALVVQQSGLIDQLAGLLPPLDHAKSEDTQASGSLDA